MIAPPKRGLLLSAGLGTRLRPLTDSVPKCLVPIKGKPLLGYWFDLMFKAGVERILVNTHYLPEQVRLFCSQSPWADRIDLIHEESLVGTAGTLRRNYSYFNGFGPFFLAHADNLSMFDPDAFFKAHAERPTECVGTMMTFKTDRPQDCGILRLNASGVVSEVFEKVANPPGNLANAAVFILEEDVLEWVSRHNEVLDFCRDVVPPLATKFYTFLNNTYHRDIGTPEALAKAETDFIWISP